MKRPARISKITASRLIGVAPAVITRLVRNGTLRVDHAKVRVADVERYIGYALPTEKIMRAQSLDPPTEGLD